MKDEEGKFTIVKSRTENAVINTKVVMICQITSIILGFICRTVFSDLLGTEYLGINGLFSNILSVLAFTELGIGSAMEFRLYSPLAKKSIETVNKYISVYRRLYFWIIVIFFLIGICAVKFLPFVVKTSEIDGNITIIYLIFLLDTGFSYFFAYKKSLLIADQKSYVVNIIMQISLIMKNGVQIIALLIIKSFILYCVIGCFFTLAGNYFCSLYVDKKYKFIQMQQGIKLEEKERQELIKDLQGLSIRRISGTAIGSTDNLFISTFIGLDIIGIISNYKLIIGTISNLQEILYNSLKASFGNLYVTSDVESTEKNFKRAFFFNTIIYGYFGIIMLFLLREFITDVWLSNIFFLPNGILIVMLIEWIMRGIHIPIFMLGNAMGLFSQNRNIMIISAVCNIILDFIFVQTYGVSGLYFATIICNGLLFARDNYAVYHYGFHKSIFGYYALLGKWSIGIVISTILSYLIKAIITVHGFWGIILKWVLISAAYFVCVLLTNIKNDEFKFFVWLIKVRIIKRYCK